MNEIGRFLVIAGILLIVAGGIFMLFGRLGLGRLPGDFVIHRGHATFYFPLATSLILSLALSLLFWLFRR